MIYMLEELVHFLLVRFAHLEEDDDKHSGANNNHGHSHDNIEVPTEASFQVRIV